MLRLLPSGPRKIPPRQKGRVEEDIMIHSYFITSYHEGFLFTLFIMRGDKYRIIRSRKATRIEEKKYQNMGEINEFKESISCWHQ